MNSSVLVVILVFALFFPLLYYSSVIDNNPSAIRPRISEQQAIMIAKAEPSKNSWFFNTLPDTTFNVLDFNDTNYFEAQFFQNGHNLPLVFISANGTIVDLNGEIRDMLRMCKEEPGFGWCKFIASLKPQTLTGDLAYLVGLEWAGRTELFVVDAIKGRVLNSTIYTKPILRLDDVQSKLQQIGEPKISQEQALILVEDDLMARYPDEFEKIILIAENLTHGYISIDEFRQRELQLPLIYIHPAGTLVFVNGTKIMPGYYCESGVYSYCGFAPPFNLNSKGRLVYGIDIVWNSGLPDTYAVDSITGEIVDSTSLRNAVRGN